jgi:probable rRNA maturation factor
MAKRLAMPLRKNLDKALVRKLDRLAAKLLRMLKIKGTALDIFLLSDREMVALKARFIKKRTEANVLSFLEPLHFPHPETKKRYLGEIYLNSDILKKNSSRSAPLLLHGILHLLGHDHKKGADVKRMESLERKILAKI